MDRDAFYAPEVYRIEGELMLINSETDAAEKCLRTALDLARSRAEKSLELRAATSLVRLWRGQGKSQEAFHLLADIYGFFTEGFETRDLLTAKAIMAELASTCG